MVKNARCRSSRLPRFRLMRGKCKHFTKPTHTPHSRTRDFFSRGLRLESSSQESLSLTNQSFLTSSTACRTRFILEHYLSTCTPIRPSSRPSTRLSLTSTSHGDLSCADPSNVSFGPLAETHSPTGYEPNDLTEEDNSVLVKPLFFHRPSMTSTCDSAESIATIPPESDLDDEQVRNTPVSPLYLQKREASADRSRVYHSLREKSVSSSSHFREGAGKPAAMFSQKRKLSQETLSDS